MVANPQRVAREDTLSQTILKRCWLKQVPCSDRSFTTDLTFVPEIKGFTSLPAAWTLFGPFIAPGHAHKKETGGELLVCLQGNAHVDLWDEDGKMERVELPPFSQTGPKGFVTFLWIPDMIWHEIICKPGSIVDIHMSTALADQKNIIAKNQFFKNP